MRGEGYCLYAMAKPLNGSVPLLLVITKTCDSNSLPGFSSDCLNNAHQHCPSIILLDPVVHFPKPRTAWIVIFVITRNPDHQHAMPVCALPLLVTSGRPPYQWPTKSTHLPPLTALSSTITPPRLVTLKHSIQYSITFSLSASTKHTSYPGSFSPS